MDRPILFIKQGKQVTQTGERKMIKFLNKDQCPQEETTIYWFDKNGATFGVGESCGEKQLLDCDGFEVEDNHTNKDEFFDSVTDEMRSDY